MKVKSSFDISSSNLQIFLTLYSEIIKDEWPCTLSNKQIDWNYYKQQL